MSAIRVKNGTYRKQSVNNIAFTLVKGFQTGAKGGFVTVKNDNHFPGFADEIRISVNGIQDFEYINGDAMQDNTVHFEKPSTVETDDEAMVKFWAVRLNETISPA